jgi:tetratricopeptide (TPR) repeat protein
MTTLDNLRTRKLQLEQHLRQGLSEEQREQIEGELIKMVKEQLRRVPDDANPDYLAAAGRVSLLARDTDMARAYFMRALEADPTSYRAALPKPSSPNYLWAATILCTRSLLIPKV